MKTWRVLLGLAAVALAALAFGLTLGRANAAVHRSDATKTEAGCGKLMNDPPAAKATQTLHAEHVKGLQTWRSTYGKNPQAAPARTALKRIPSEHRNAMREALAKLGIKCASAACAGGMMGVDMTGMMGSHVTGDGGDMMGGAGPSDMMDGPGMIGGGTL